VAGRVLVPDVDKGLGAEWVGHWQADLAVTVFAANAAILSPISQVSPAVKWNVPNVETK